MHLVYAIASYLLFVVTLPVLLSHPKLRSGKRLRLGLYPADLARGKGTPRVWMHGASAGDLEQIKNEFEEFCKQITPKSKQGKLKPKTMQYKSHRNLHREESKHLMTEKTGH